MIAGANMPSVDSRAWALLWLLVLISASVVAQEARETTLPSNYMEQIREQIYSDAGEWRADAEDEDLDWREPAPLPEQRSRFGYDPEFDERLHRGDFRDYNTQHRFGEPEPSTFFRMELD